MNLSPENREWLRRLPYERFLKTEFWMQVREWIQERDNYTCQMCGDDRQRFFLNVHHRTYEHRGWEDCYLEDIILLCGECHQDVHRKGLETWPFKQDPNAGFQTSAEVIEANPALLRLICGAR